MKSRLVSTENNGKRGGIKNTAKPRPGSHVSPPKDVSSDIVEIKKGNLALMFSNAMRNWADNTWSGIYG